MEAWTSLLLLFVLLCILAGFFPISHPWLTKKVTSLMHSAGADSCSIGSVKVVAWRSITLQRVFIEERIDSDREYRFSFIEAKIAANLFQLLWNRKKIRSSILSGEPDLFTSLYVRPASASERLFFAKNSVSGIKGGRITDLSFSVKLKNREILRGNNGDMDFGNSDENSSDGEIKIAFPFLQISGDGIENMKCAVSFTSQGEVFLQNCTAKYYDGKIKARGTINLREDRIDSYLLTIEKMDFAYWYAVHVGIGEISGRTNINLEGGNVPLSRPVQQAELRMVVSPCVINDLPVQQSLATSLFIPSLSAIEFSKVTARAVIDTGDTIKTAFSGDGDQINFSTTGWVRRDGLLQQQLDGTFSRKMISSLPPIVGKTLERAEDGGRRFRCRLFGSFNDPRFELDKETLRRAVGTMFDEFRQDLQQYYQK